MVMVDGRTESTLGNRVIEVAKVTPTIWPLVFAAIVGNLLKFIALLRAEKGTTLGTLEQLMASQTVFGTLKICYTLRAFGFATATLIVLWALNPLGGQASLRALTLHSQFASSAVQIQYLNSDPRSTVTYTGFNGASTFASEGVLIRTLYGAALFTPDSGAIYSNGSSTSFDDLINRLGGQVAATKGSTMDIWGGVRIPVVHLLPGFNPNQPQEWTEVPSDEIAQYASIIGVPTRGLPAGVGNTTFDIAANYDTFKCSHWTTFTDQEWNTWWANNSHTFILYNETVSQNNHTTEPFSNGLTGGFFVDTQEPFSSSRQSVWPNDTSAQLPARNLIFGSHGAIGKAYLTTCQIRMEYVNVRISCTRSNAEGQLSCAAIAAQLSSSTHLPNNWTEVDAEGMSGIPMLWPTIMGAQHTVTSTPTEIFIRDPPTAFTGDTLVVTPVELGDVPIDVFERRFMLLYNTYWRSSVAPWVVLGGIFNASMPLFSGTGSIPFLNTSGEWSFPTDPVYRLETPWIVLYLIAASTLCLCSILTIIIQYQVRAPELLGYVSSLTRDSPYAAVPNSASALNGDERARLLKNQRACIQDIQPNRSVGRIVFSLGSVKGVGLQADRFYE